MCALSLSLPLRGVRKQPTDMGLSYITSAMLLLLAINLKVVYIFEFLSHKSIAKQDKKRAILKDILYQGSPNRPLRALVVFWAGGGGRGGMYAHGELHNS